MSQQNQHLSESLEHTTSKPLSRRKMLRMSATAIGGTMLGLRLGQRGLALAHTNNENETVAPQSLRSGSRDRKHFVIIHGAWHNKRALKGLARKLKREGHSVTIPTMPGHRPNDPRRSTVTFDDYVQKIVRVVEKKYHPGKPIVLVGHSSAGFLLQSAAPLVADKLERLIFNNAWILQTGQSQFDLVPPEIAGLMIDLAAAAGDNSVPVLEDFVRNTLMAGDLVANQDALLEILVPQPLPLFTTAIDTTAFDALSTPKSVVYCQDDTSLPPGAFLGMASAGLRSFDLIEIPGGHETLFTHPEAMATALLQAVGITV